MDGGLGAIKRTDEGRLAEEGGEGFGGDGQQNVIKIKENCYTNGYFINYTDTEVILVV